MKLKSEDEVLDIYEPNDEGTIEAQCQAENSGKSKLSLRQRRV